MADAAESAERRRGLRASAIRLGLETSDRQLDQLLGFVGLLEKWNRVYNLTSIRDTDAVLSHHVVDCLAVVEPLRRRRIDAKTRLFDVGSGGGLPGVVIAVMEPSWAITCVDAVGKKAAFVQQVAASLGLHNLRSEHARVETFQAPPFDVVTSRAFASLVDFVTLTRHLIDPGGAWMAMKGRRPDDDIAALPADVCVFHVEQLPDLDIGERCLVWMKPAPK